MSHVPRETSAQARRLFHEEHPLTAQFATDAAAQSPAPDAILTVPGDCPFLPDDLVARLLEGMGDGDAAIAASTGQIHPLTGLWRAGLLPRLQQATQVEGLRAARHWAAAIGAAEVEFPGEPFDPLFNINTPEDLVRAQALAERFKL